MAKKLRCYLGIHRWVDCVTDDGEPYRRCRHCGKFLDTALPLRSIGGAKTPY